MLGDKLTLGEALTLGLVLGVALGVVLGTLLKLGARLPLGEALGAALGVVLGILLMLGDTLTLGEALTLGLVLGAALGAGSASVTASSFCTKTSGKIGFWQVLNRICVGSVTTQLLLQQCASLKHLSPRSCRSHSTPPVNSKLCCT